MTISLPRNNLKLLYKNNCYIIKGAIDIIKEKYSHFTSRIDGESAFRIENEIIKVINNF